MATGSTNQESDLFLFRLQKLIIDGGTTVVRNIFDYKVSEQGMSLFDFLNQEQSTIKDKITKPQYKKLYPEGGKPPNSRDFDIPLIINLLTHLPFRKPQNPTDPSQDQDLNSLRRFRNKISHVPSTTPFDEPTFNKYWKEITQVLLRLNVGPRSDPYLEQTIGGYKRDPLDKVAEKRYQDLLEKWQRQDASMEKLNETIGKLVETVQYLSDKVDDGNKTKKNDAEDGEAPSNKTLQNNPEQNLTSIPFDGRLVQLEHTHIKTIIKEQTCYLDEGGFGIVYYSKKNVEQFGMKIAVKKCRAKNASVIRREMFASRIKNPFILPLLAVAESEGKNLEKEDTSSKKIYFVSPYFEGGDLLHAIAKHRPPNEIKMNQLTRLKILLQIALAIQYLHTKVDTIRGVMLHKDICSRNVVLDENYNARLIDFGMTREKNEESSSRGIPKFAYEHPDIHDKYKHSTESWDYYAFGVVIREMLTGFPPNGDKEIEYLRTMKTEDISKHSKDSKVWSNEVAAQKLNAIAADCLNETHRDWNVKDFKKEVVDKIKDICRECVILKFLDLSEDQQKRCHSCIINPVGKKSSMKQDHRANCTQKIQVCIACEKNSFLNPVTCYCGTELKPCIGSGWGALLVAGNHSDDSLANTLTQDVKEMKRVITSKAPRIMGISEKNVRIVVPAKPGKPMSGEEPEKLKQGLMSKLMDIRQDEIDTLLVYFSCEGIKDDADEDNETFRFKLASGEDVVYLHEFTTELNKLANVNNLIVFLDCCNAPLLPDIGKKKLLQITSCKENEKAIVDDIGSRFTKYVIQGLKAKSEQTCPKECPHCIQYWQKQDSFISAQSLFDYVKDHMGSQAYTPEPDIKMRSEFPLAFYTDELVEIDFTSFEEEKKKVKLVPLQYFGTMDQLEEKLLDEFGKDKTVKVVIKKKTFRKKDEKKEENCSSLDQIMSAWVQRHPLYVSFQAPSSPGSEEKV